MRTAEPAAPPRPFRGLAAFVACEWRVQYHEGLAIFTSMVTPAVLLTFVAILARPLFPIAFVGAILFSSFTLGQRVLNEAAYIRIDHKLHELFLASPLAPESYFLGMAAGVLLAYLPPICILGAAAEILLRPPLVAGLLLIATATLVWIFSSALGYILSTFFRDQRAIWSYASLLFNLFGVLPPVFYPLARFPGALRPVALAMPPSAASALVQNALSPGVLSTTEALATAAGLVALAFGMLAIAVRWSRATVRGN